MTTTALGDNRIMATYPDPPVTFVQGRGTLLFDDTGKEYLDFLSGLAVTSLGHAHPEVAAAISSQAGKLLHVSNLFGTEPGARLSVQLDTLLGGGGRVFFANSGAEANEAALKLARKWAGPGRFVVLTALMSFHGRTLATLHATGQTEKHSAFQPLPEGFRHVPWEDFDAMESAVTDDVAAVLLEPIQGEGGVNEASYGYLHNVQNLCRDRDVLFMVDEVQTGLGRTGAWFAFQHHDLDPDVVTLAKALGNGVPIGAMWAKDHVASAFGPGDHATTFGGQPLAAAAASKVVDILIEMDAPARAQTSGEFLTARLAGLPGVIGVRGRGLLLAAEMSNRPATDVVRDALEAGLVINAVTPTAIRLAPPLNVTTEEIEQAVAILRSVLT